MSPRPKLYTKNSDFEKDFYLIENEEISDTNRMILKAFDQIAPFEGMKSIQDYLAKQDFTISLGAIKLLFKELIETGVLNEIQQKDRITNKLIYKLTLGSIRPYASKKREKRKLKKPTGKTRIKHREKAITALEETTNNNYLDLRQNSQCTIDQLFCIVDASMKSSHKDKALKKQIKYYFSKTDYIEITSLTTTDENDDIALLSDQRVIRILNGAYRDRIKILDDDDQGLHDGEFGFDLHDLMKQMAMPNIGNNKNLVRKMIRRLKSTVFKIDATNSKHFFNVFGVDVMELRYFTEFSALTESEITNTDDKKDSNCSILLNGDSKLSERFYKVRLHSKIVEAMSREGGAFISHPALARERNGLAHRTNNWCKAVVGVRPSQDKHLIYTIDQLHEKVHPASTRQNFARDFYNLLNRQTNCVLETDNDTLKLTATLYGYIFELNDSEEEFKILTRKAGRRMPNRKRDFWVISIRRDPHDEFVGDNSSHNLALRSETNRFKKLMNTPA